jgi:hypothetical protein
LAGDHHESGRLTNHQALICLCLEKMGRLFGSDRWDALKAKRLARVLQWQNEEGWFQEYEGCDPGYHTLTVALLAQLHELARSEPLERALRKAIAFAAHFVHPDGSFGGEYTSRNTYNFFPHGFEIAGRWLPEALAVNDRFLAGWPADSARATRTITSSATTRGAISWPTSISAARGRLLRSPQAAASISRTPESSSSGAAQRRSTSR